MTGVQIGLFGQSDHWKLDTIGQATFRGTPTRKMSHTVIAQSAENSEKENDDKAQLSASFITDIKSHPPDDTVSNDFEIPDVETTEFVYKREYTGLIPQLTFEFEQDAFIKDTSLRYNPWSKTILGKSYQECRIKKRDRRQPGIIQSEEFQIWDKTGQAPGGLYGVS